MKTEIVDLLNLDNEQIRLFRALLASNSENISELTRIAGLDPSSDYVGLDLSGADFSNCDLRGYNFSHANLKGAFGINVVIDSTTIFENANLDGSCFALHADIQHQIYAVASNRMQLERLERGDWIHGSLWIIENVVKKRNTQAELIAKALYVRSNDSSLKSQILYFIGDSFVNDEMYKEFLLAELIKPNYVLPIQRNVLFLLAKKFADDKDVASIISSFMRHSDPDVRVNCFKAVIRTRYRRSQLSMLRAFLDQESDSSVRRACVEAVASRLGAKYAVIAKEPSGGSFLDFRQPIDEGKFLSITRNLIRYLFAQDANFVEYNLDIGTKVIVRRARECDRLFSDFAHFGIKFERLYNLEHLDPQKARL